MNSSEGLAMLQALSSAQKEKAVLSFSKTGNNNLDEAFKDNVVLDYAGVRADGLGRSSRRAPRSGRDVYRQHG